jgi:hypothetical protein
MAFAAYKELVEAEEAGKTAYYEWRKNPAVTVTQGFWFDMSMAAGYPAPQYYAATPLTATSMSFSSDRGIVHGTATSKYLRSTNVWATQNNHTPSNMLLLDYLMYYPFIDEGTTDPQTMNNSSTLPRYTDGQGVRIMAITQGARAGSPYFSVSYTNQDGVSGRTTVAHRMNNEAYNGCVATSNRAVGDSANPFLCLQSGDTGVRSIQSVTLATSDVGLFALVLVKPLAQTTIREIGAPNEKDYLLQTGTIPEIQNDAYLNWLINPNGIFNGSNIQGNLKVMWT